MIIFVYNGRERHVIEVKPSDSVLCLRRKLASSGIPMTYYCLKYQGIYLNRSKLIRDYDIRSGDILEVESVIVAESCSYFQLSVVKNGDQVLKLVTTPSQSVEEVKRELARETGLAEDTMILKAGDEDLRNDMSLGDYAITSDAVLWLEVKRPRRSIVPFLVLLPLLVFGFWMTVC